MPRRSLLAVLVALACGACTSTPVAPSAQIAEPSVDITPVAPVAVSSPQAAPTLDAISPGSGTSGTLVDVLLTGSHFVKDKTTIAVHSAGVAVTNVTVKSDTAIAATFVIGPGTVPRAHHVTATTPGGTTDAQVFAVTAPASATAPAVAPPRVGILEALPATVHAGANVTLHWTSSAGAMSCEIDHGVGAVSCGGGNRGVHPRADTSFTLTAVGPGGSAKTSAGVRVLPAGAAAPSTAHGAKTFSYTGGTQTFVVPEGVTEIEVEASGGQGGSGETPDGIEDGGKGGEIDATIPVTPGEELVIVVGGEGQSPTHDNEAGTGGFNGGGDAPPAEHAGGGGGGESDIRQGGSSPENIVVEAGGGGGGGGGDQSGTGGKGGNGGGNGIGHGVTGGSPGNAPGQEAKSGDGGQSAASDKAKDVTNKPGNHKGNGEVVVKW